MATASSPADDFEKDIVDGGDPSTSLDGDIDAETTTTDSSKPAPRVPWTLLIWERLTVKGSRPAPKSKEVDSDQQTGSDRAKPAAVAKPMSDAEKKAWIRGLEPREQRFGYWAAALAFVLSLLTLPDVITDHLAKENGKLVTTQGTYALLFGVQLILVVLLVLATRFKKRPFLGFAVLMTGLVNGRSILLGLPFLAFFGWLIVRAWRVQRYGTADAKLAAAAAAERRKTGSSRSSGSTTTARARGKTQPAKGSKTTKTTTPGRTPPAASKRYTPKSAPAKRSRTRSSN